MSRITFTASIDKDGIIYSSSMHLPDIFFEAYKPIEESDCFIGDRTPAKDVQRIIKMRDDAAVLVAKSLAEQIIKSMSGKDTVNGYHK